MNRRTFLCGLTLGMLAAPLAVGAQQAPARVRRIGLLSPWTPADTEPWHQAFRLGLRDLGWVEGQNISIEYRYAEGRHDRLPELAADLVRLKVDVIVASVTPDALAAQKATKAIPIVMVAAGDPVLSGLVESLARPGGNVTGLSQMSYEMGGKRLQLLKGNSSEALPRGCAPESSKLKLDAELERTSTPGTAAGPPASFAGGTEPQRFRPSVRRRDPGAR